MLAMWKKVTRIFQFLFLGLEDEDVEILESRHDMFLLDDDGEYV
jgi:hypothetical protein